MGLSRSSYRYQARSKDDLELRKALNRLAVQHPKCGQRMLYRYLRQLGFDDNHKRVERIYREEKLALRLKRRKKRRLMPKYKNAYETQGPMDVWAIDFMQDRSVRSGKFRILTIVDEYTRICPGTLVSGSITGSRVCTVLDVLATRTGYPAKIRCDNGPEFISDKLRNWAANRNIEIIYSRPGKPTDNAYIESFNGRFRYECLDATLFLNIIEARKKINNWVTHYNHKRPHSSLGYCAPAVFAEQCKNMLNNQNTRFQTGS